MHDGETENSFAPEKEKYPLISSLRFPGDIKKLDDSQMKALCAEVRGFLVDYISVNGGHLASNLGVVEIIAAVHRVFDTGTDRLVFDVGHQCYAHKIFTGRAELFSTLRRMDGLSGFPKPGESPDDAFISGHASTSVSVALGMARADKLLGSGEKRHFIALIGDGAMGGGLAYEALNDAGAGETPLIVILNDNGMSISSSVGALSKILTRFRVKKRYRNAKKTYHRVMKALPGGKYLNRLLYSVKAFVKHLFINGSYFESMGFEYIGPVDGHDVEELSGILAQAKTYDRPVLIHAVTKKGKGYSHSEGSPDVFHGTDGFDIDSGERLVNGSGSFSREMGDALCALAAEHGEIAAVTAAMLAGTGLSGFAKRFPDRCFDVGIAEGHAVTMSAGLAAGGARPFAVIYSTFLQRSCDQLLHDVGIMSLPVVFCVDRAGLVGEDGETHQGLYDLAMLCAVPGMRVYMPSNYIELASMLRAAYKDASGPAAIRYPRGGEAAFKEDTSGAPAALLKPGGDLTIIASGRLIDAALGAAADLEGRGIFAGVAKLNRIWPLPVDEIMKISQKRILFCEEAADSCGVGARLAAAIAGEGYAIKRQNCKNGYIPQATMAEQLALCGLDRAGIAAAARELNGKFF